MVYSMRKKRNSCSVHLHRTAVYLAFRALPAGKNALENQAEQQRKDHAEHILRDTQTDRAFESVCAGCNSERTERVEHSLPAVFRGKTDTDAANHADIGVNRGRKQEIQR